MQSLSPLMSSIVHDSEPSMAITSYCAINLLEGYYVVKMVKVSMIFISWPVTWYF